MAFSALGDPGLWLAALAGGALGAALGAYPSLVLSGLVVVAGEALSAFTTDVPGGTPLGPDQVGAGVTGTVALGPVLGPHVAFAGGVAAAAYAARKGDLERRAGYGAAKNVFVGLGTRPRVLGVGAAAGALGFAARHALGGLGVPFDPIFASVVLTGLLARVAFGYPLVGGVRGDGLLDMTPFERGERRYPPDGAETMADAGKGAMADVLLTRLTVEPWLPEQYDWGNVAAVGAVGGVLAAYVAVVTGSPFLAFGISLASLAFLVVDAGNVPVTHHVTLPAGTAALAAASPGDAVLAGSGLVVTVLVGAVVGVVAALAAELFQRAAYAHGDTHWDPSAAGIVVGTLLVGLLALAGVLPTAVWLPG